MATLDEKDLSTAKVPDFEKIRGEQYGYLDHESHIYLDYAGAGLASQSQIQLSSKRLTSVTAGNPHTISPASAISTQLLDQTRSRILRFFNASPEEYTVVFTSNATAAIKLVGESYPFSKKSRLVLTTDNHNSINGLRCFARSAQTHTEYIPIDRRELRTQTAAVASALSRCRARRRLLGKASQGGLFAYPAQSNYTGVRHPLSWVKLAQDEGYHVLLDAAAYLPTARLDMAKVKPEFLVCSWYKIFGFPTGVGCLVARHSSLAMLKRPWFSGGTVQAALTTPRWHSLHKGPEGFEDGTLSFLTIPDVQHGLDWLENIGVENVGSRVTGLTKWLIESLRNLYHSNGNRLVVIHGPESMIDRGATVAFNIIDPEGAQVDEDTIAEESAAAKISLRTGCFCNPGAGEAAQNMSQGELARWVKALNGSKHEGALPSRAIPGAIRVSLGIASAARDVKALIRFIEENYRDRFMKPKHLDFKAQMGTRPQNKAWSAQAKAKEGCASCI